MSTSPAPHETSPRRRPLRGLALLLLCGASGCGAILGVDFGGAILAGDEGGVDEGDGGGDRREGTGDAAGDGIAPLDARVDTGSSQGCSSTRGPTMVHIDDDAGGVHFCIDSTEVSRADYLAFVDAVNETDLKALGASMPRVCKARFARAPDAGPLDVAVALQKANVGSTGTRAVTNVGWCQAHAYCAWAGKRLCGALVNGAPHVIDMTPDSTQEWVYACTHGGTRTHSYGSSPVEGRCNNTLANGSSTPIEGVGTRPQCQGGYPGIFDLLGNVAEWENGYKGDAGDPDYVSARGSWNLSSFTQRCTDHGGDPDRGPAESGEDRTGIRCCATP